MVQATHSIEVQKRAQNYVKRLKAWYWQIPLNLIVTATMAALSFLMYSNNEPNTIIWILMSGPITLWIIFIVQGVLYKKSKVLCKWEERQIRKYMDKD